MKIEDINVYEYKKYSKMVIFCAVYRDWYPTVTPDAGLSKFQNFLIDKDVWTSSGNKLRLNIKHTALRMSCYAPHTIFTTKEPINLLKPRL